MEEQEVSRIAGLARIKLSLPEIKKLAQELSSILDFVKKLNEVDTSNVEPLFNTTSLVDVVREDVELKDQSLGSKKALQNAPEKDNQYFKVKPVL